MIWYLSSFPDDPESFRLRGRAYRSEADILAVLLRILSVSERPVKKTRLIQYANLNTRSFSKYMKYLIESGLVRRGEGGYTITGKGRLALTLLEALHSLMTPPGEIDADKALSKVCEAAQQSGWSCAKHSGPFDLLIHQPGGPQVGVVTASCTTSTALRLVASIAESEAPHGYRIALLCIGCPRGAPIVPVTALPPGSILYYMCRGDDKDIEGFLRALQAQQLKPQTSHPTPRHEGPGGTPQGE